MKKLLVVFVALLVVAFAVPAMATDFTWSGDFNFGFATVVDAEKDAVGWGDLELNLEAAVDDYNTVTIETNYDSMAGAGPIFLAIDVAKIDTDIGSFFGLPVGVVFSGGYFEPGGESYVDETTGWEIEDVTEDGIVPAAGTGAINIEVDAGMVIIDVGMTVAQGVDAVTGDDVWDLYLGAAVPDIAGMAKAEVYYAVVDNSEFKGWFGIDGQAEVGPATVGVTLSVPTMDLADDPLTTSNEADISFKYGVGASAGISMLTAGVSIDGNSEDIANLIGIDVNVAATDDLGLDIGTAIGLYDKAQAFQCFDVSAYASIGASTLRLGYVYTDTTKPATDHVTKDSYKAPAILADGKGGLYLNIGTEF